MEIGGVQGSTKGKQITNEAKMRKLRLLTYRVVCHVLIHTFYLPIYMIMLTAITLDIVTFGIFFRRTFARWWFGKDCIGDDGEINL